MSTTLDFVPFANSRLHLSQLQNSITMKVLCVLAALVAVAVAQYAEPNYPPIPYSFTYEAPTEDGGSSSRTESGDGAGRVEGSYTVNDLEGNSRVVEYIADEGGFRVLNLRTNEPGNSRVVEYIADEGGFRVLNLRTNEPGTANQSPADVNIESSAGGAINYALGAGAPAAGRSAVRVAPAAPARGAGRYVLVPVTDPRARGYY